MSSIDAKNVTESWLIFLAELKRLDPYVLFMYWMVATEFYKFLVLQIII